MGISEFYVKSRDGGMLWAMGDAMRCAKRNVPSERRGKRLLGFRSQNATQDTRPVILSSNPGWTSGSRHGQTAGCTGWDGPAGDGITSLCTRGSGRSEEVRAVEGDMPRTRAGRPAKQGKQAGQASRASQQSRDGQII